MTAPRGPLKILLVEDRAADAELIVAELQKDGIAFASVAVAETRREFEEQLAQLPDVILCDYSLPNFNALEALGVLKERKLRIPFIIVSGSIGEETAVEAIKAGADDYLLKDRLARLITSISQALEDEQLRQSAERAEEDLRQSEFKYRSLFDHLVDAAFLCDSRTGRIIDTNQRSVLLLGQERSAILGTRLSQYVTSDVWSSLHDFGSAPANGDFEQETTIAVPHGPSRPAQVRATVVEIHRRHLLFVFLRAKEAIAGR